MYTYSVESVKIPLNSGSGLVAKSAISIRGQMFSRIVCGRAEGKIWAAYEEMLKELRAGPCGFLDRLGSRHLL
jgi:hypothetical protein